MRFLDPSVGEVVDRLTILAMKLRDRPGVVPLVMEYAAIQARFWDRVDAKIMSDHAAMALYRWTLELAAVNAAIWQITDQIQGGTYDAVAEGEMARKALQFNRERADLVRDISGLFGEAVEEKG